MLSSSAPLPSEILDLICQQLKEKDISSLRLVSRKWHDVATAYLLPTADLIVKKTNFQRLQEIAEHPVFSQHVKRLVYEPTTITGRDREGWDLDTRYYADVIDCQSPSQNDWDQHSSTHVWIGGSFFKRYSKEEKDKAWSRYQIYCEEQDEMLAGDWIADHIYSALSRMPALKAIHFYHPWIFSGRAAEHKNKRRPFADALWHPGIDHDLQALQNGLIHMESLFRAIHRSGIRLHELSLGIVSWKYLQWDHPIFETVKTVIRHLNDLEINLSTDVDRKDQPIRADKAAFSAFLSTRALGQFLAAAPHLRRLALSFNVAADFATIALETHWPYLREVAFALIVATKESFLAFFKRHARSLKRLRLKSIALIGGQWSNVLEQMQAMLSLQSFRLEGYLFCLEPRQAWNLDEYGYSRDWKNDDLKAAWAGEAMSPLRRFMLEGGKCPLYDEEMYPQNSSNFSLDW